jgi:signal transduction histidine kinase/ligand-binding sensor domain-containing protein/DNA-binding response OmpR family regulator
MVPDTQDITPLSPFCYRITFIYLYIYRLNYPHFFVMKASVRRFFSFVGSTLLLVLTYVGISFAQTSNLSFNHITIEQGLSQNTISCIYQDRQGFLWFGTEDGLNRYDGYTFVVYRHEPGNTNSFSDNEVTTILQDREGIFWIGTQGGGLNRFDPATQRFTHYKYQPGSNKGPSGNQIQSIAEDHNGALWMAIAGSGLNRMDKASGSFTHYFNDPKDSGSIANNFVTSVLVDRSGTVWAGASEGGLNKYNAATDKFTRYENVPGHPASLPANTIYTMIEDRSGILWLGSFGGTLIRFDPATSQFTRYDNVSKGTNSIDNNLVTSICEDARGDIWISTLGNGLNRFDRKSGTFEIHRNQPGNARSLSSDNLMAVYSDRSGILWAGTYGKGLDKLDRLSGRFTHYFNRSGDPNSLSSNLIAAILEDHTGQLWIGTMDNGLNRLDPATGRVQRYQNRLGDKSSLSSNTIFNLCEDRSGVIWAATLNGLNQFDPKTGRFIRYQASSTDTTSLNGTIVSDIFEDRTGTLWVGGRGLSRMDRNTGKFKRYDPVRETGSPEPILIEQMLEDQSGTFWLGSDAGLHQFDRQTGKFSMYKANPSDTIGSVTAQVQCLYEDKKGFLWVSTSNGLYRLDTKRGLSRLYQKKDGLPSNAVLGIQEDDRGRIWLSTPEGLSRFDPANGSFRNYNAADGTQSNEFVKYAYGKVRGGKLMFGGINGLNIFHPDSLRDNTQVPPVILTDFLVFNQSLPIGPKRDQLTLEKSITLTQAIELPFDANVFSFEFAALDYTRPEKNQYAYQMEGFDKDWVQAGTRRFVTYTNLDPGTYTFRVKGSNNDGIWNEQGTAIQITVLPPWWRTWWAYGLYALTFATGLYLIYRYLISRERLRNQLQIKQLESEKLQEVDQMKTRFFTNISHEFRTPLTLILGPLQQLIAQPAADPESNRKVYTLMQRQAQRLLQLINQLLDISKLEAGRVRLEAVELDLVKYLRAITYSFISLAESRQISLSFFSSQESLRAYFDKDKLEKMISNLLSNAFKFTPEGGEINVQLEIVDGGAVAITVQDSGIGIPANRLNRIFDRFYQVDGSHTREQEGTGIGLALTKELVLLHRGTISVESELGKGTRFNLRFPLGSSHLGEDEIIKVSESENEGLEVQVKPSVALVEDGSPVLPETDGQAYSHLPLILVVEDNADVRGYIREHFDFKYRVIEARDGQAGLDRAIEQVPDLIISDLMMPKMDGIELCRRLKTDERTSHIPVILLTARATGESKVEGLETGADDYLTKPFNPQELQVRVKNLIEQRQKLRERFGREVKLQPRDVAITSADEKFLNRAVEIVEKEMDNADFSVEDFESAMSLSKMQLYRKLKGLTNQSPNEFIRTLRLKKAAMLLDKRSGNIAEITYEVGFNNLSYFSKCFKDLYGVTPSEYLNRQAESVAPQPPKGEKV